MRKIIHVDMDRRHEDNLWLLGGEIVRELNYNPALRTVPAQKLLRDVVGADGGPLIYNVSEEEQRSLDATCRKLHRFLHQRPALRPQITHKSLGRAFQFSTDMNFRTS